MQNSEHDSVAFNYDYGRTFRPPLTYALLYSVILKWKLPFKSTSAVTKTGHDQL